MDEVLQVGAATVSPVHQMVPVNPQMYVDRLQRWHPTRREGPVLRTLAITAQAALGIRLRNPSIRAILSRSEKGWGDKKPPISESV